MNNMSHRWHNALSRPIAFVLSGGANLGAIQIGMLRALAQVGLTPDLVVGSSVGALNGAVVANWELSEAVNILEGIWCDLGRHDIFPGGILTQAKRLLATRISLFPQDPIADLICQALLVDEFEQLQLPFGALATELMTHRGTLFNSGKIRPALLASTAIPGIYPPVDINGVLYVDGGLVANVPLYPAVQMGAASLVVLDAGNTCQRSRPPRHVAEMMAVTLHAAFRQRVLVEAPLIAAERSILYLPTPCPVAQSLFDFNHTAELIAQAAETTAAFLADAPLPAPGAMTGSPHFHDETRPGNITFATTS